MPSKEPFPPNHTARDGIHLARNQATLRHQCGICYSIIRHSHVLLFILLLPFAVRLQGQDLDHLHFKHLTPAQGLNQSVVNDIFQDRYGLMWFTTYDGINRFDGLQCINQHDLGSGWGDAKICRGIVEDTLHNAIYIGSDIGLLRYDRGLRTFEVVGIDYGEFTPPMQGHARKTPLAMKGGSLLMADQGCDLKILDLTTRKVMESLDLCAPAVGENQVQILSKLFAPFGEAFHFGNWLEGQLRVVWIYEDQEHNLCYKSKSLHLPAFKEHSTYPSIVRIGEHIFISTSEVFAEGSAPVYRFNTRTELLEPAYWIPTSVVRMVQAVDKKLWVGTDRGLRVYDAVSMQELGQISHDPLDPESILSNNTEKVHLSQDGILWVVAWGKGLSYAPYHTQGVKHYFRDAAAKRAGVSNFIRGVVRASDGMYYCNTAGGGVVAFDAQLRFHKQIHPANASFIASDGRYIYFGNGGLNQFDTQSGTIKVYHPQDSLGQPQNSGALSDYLWMHVMRDGKLLLASRLGGVWTFDANTRNWQHIKELSSEENQYHAFATELRDGSLLISNQNGSVSLYKTSPSGYAHHKTWEVNFAPRCFFAESDTALYLGGNRGLIRINPRKAGTFQHWQAPAHLPNNTVYGLAANGDGRLWISTNTGLALFDPKRENYQFVPGLGSLQRVEYNTAAVHQAPDGQIIWGHTNGFTKVDPGHFQHIQHSSPRLYLHAEVPNAEQAVLKTDLTEREIHLPKGTQIATIRCSAIDYANAEAYTLKYRLLGASDEWMESTSPAMATFVKLKPGRYTFEASASLMGQYTANVHRYVLYIPAFWWETRLFQFTAWALIIALAAAVVLWYNRVKLKEKSLRLEKEMELYQERSRITADLHDDLGAALSSVNIFTDLAINSLDTKPEVSLRLLQKLKVQSSELMSNMNDIIWSLKHHKQGDATLEIRLKNHSTDILAERGIEVVYHFDPALSSGLGHPMYLKNVVLIAREAFNNIGKHSNAKQVWVKLMQEGKVVVFAITDDGQGMDLSKVRRGNGLDNIRQRCEQLGGTLALSSSPGGGVHIRCLLPMTIFSYKP